MLQGLRQHEVEATSPDLEAQDIVDTINSLIGRVRAHAYYSLLEVAKRRRRCRRAWLKPGPTAKSSATEQSTRTDKSCTRSPRSTEITAQSLVGRSSGMLPDEKLVFDHISNAGNTGLALLNVPGTRRTTDASYPQASGPRP